MDRFSKGVKFLDLDYDILKFSAEKSLDSHANLVFRVSRIYSDPKPQGTSSFVGMGAHSRL